DDFFCVAFCPTERVAEPGACAGHRFGLFVRHLSAHHHVVVRICVVVFCRPAGGRKAIAKRPLAWDNISTSGGTVSMNIGIDAHMLGHNETGNETYVLELVRALAVRDPGDTFFVYVENPHALSPEITNAAQVRVVPYATRSGARRLVWELSRRAAQDCLDVLHLSYNAPLHVPPACALVVTIHDISFEHFPQFFSRRLRAFLRVSVPRSAYAAQHIITDTESAKRDLVNTYRLPPDK